MLNIHGKHIEGIVDIMGQDKFIKSWEMKSPNAKHTLKIELWERPNGKRYRKAHKK